MAAHPPVSSAWVHSRTPTSQIDTRIKVVHFANRLLVFVMQGPVDRVSSYAELKIGTDALSGHQDLSTSVVFGERDDIWQQVVARRAAEVAKKDMLFAFGLSKQVSNDQEAKDVSDAVNAALLNFLQA